MMSLWTSRSRRIEKSPDSERRVPFAILSKRLMSYLLCIYLITLLQLRLRYAAIYIYSSEHRHE